MTETVQMDAVESAPVASSESVHMPDSSPSQPSAEPMVPQSKANELFGAGMAKGYRKAQDEYQNQMNTAQDPVQQTTPPSAQHNPDIDGMIEKRVSDYISQHQQEQERKAQEAQQQAEMNRLFSEMNSKVEAAKDRYPDYEDQLANLNGVFSNKLELLHYVNSVDNSGDVLYELAKNPMKLVAIEDLAKMSPHLGMSEIRKLSDSIKKNETAKKTFQSAEPLSQLKSSNVGTDDGPRTINDFRQLYRV